jgi:hypothetical protein
MRGVCTTFTFGALWKLIPSVTIAKDGKITSENESCGPLEHSWSLDHLLQILADEIEMFASHL